MEIWGDKTIALLDVWSFEHFISGITIGGLVLYFTRNKSLSVWHFFGIVLTLAYLWEFFEYQLEVGRSGIERVTYWFQGVEHWANRLGSDPFFVLIGALLGRRHVFTQIPARFVSLIWMGTHVFVFPHCMYLHTLF